MKSAIVKLASEAITVMTAIKISKFDNKAPERIAKLLMSDVTGKGFIF